MVDTTDLVVLGSVSGRGTELSLDILGRAGGGEMASILADLADVILDEFRV
jgi:hypothetical protein